MKNIMYRVYEHLLPRSEAWKAVIEKTLSTFFAGLVQLPCFTKHHFDFILGDVFPQSTRQLDLWEQQFGLLTTLPTEQERRDRLDAQWKAIGGQSPRYIQDILNDNGFSVYVHEWWYYDFDFVSYVICGNSNAVCGNANAVSGGFTGIQIELIKYEIPSDPDTWPYFWYIGNVDFGVPVDIPIERKEEFETLILKIKPRQTWVGLFINYV